jgi:hypothetical protein
VRIHFQDDVPYAGLTRRVEAAGNPPIGLHRESKGVVLANCVSPGNDLRERVEQIIDDLPEPEGEGAAVHKVADYLVPAERTPRAASTRQVRMAGRGRALVEAGLAAASAALLLLTLASPEWMEAVFHVHPDAGDGSLEWIIVCLLLVSTVLLTATARSDWRRVQTADSPA